MLLFYTAWIAWFIDIFVWTFNVVNNSFFLLFQEELDKLVKESSQPAPKGDEQKSEGKSKIYS